MYKIAVFDDHPIVKLSLEAILNKESEQYQFFNIHDTKDLLKLTKDRILDMLLLDVSYPGVDTLKLLNDCLLLNPDLCILVFSSNLDIFYGKKFIKAGARGYLNKSSNPFEVKRAVETVLEGKKYFSEKLLYKLSEDALHNKPDNAFDTLSRRELEIVNQLVVGDGTNEIAKTLSVQPNTVTTLKGRIFEKLGVKNIIELYNLFLIHYPKA
jgi:DNA-binding NarL/FixJ family response regulator